MRLKKIILVFLFIVATLIVNKKIFPALPLPVTSSYLPYYTGQLIKWWDDLHGDSADDIPVIYHINPNTTDTTGEATAVENAFNTWENVTTSYMDFTRGSDTSATNYGTDSNNYIIGWSTNLSSSTIAVCWITYSTTTGRILDADIEFNDGDYDWNTSGSPTLLQMDVQNIATHEIGHFLGLADLYASTDTYSNDPDSDSVTIEKTMYGKASGGETKKGTLHTDDINGASYLYPTGTDDSYEQNDHYGQAATVSSGTHSSLYLLDHDWYKISLSVGDDITVRITFTHSNGDIDLRLYNPSRSLLDGSYGVGDSEEVSATDVTTAGTYYILVYGYYCDTNTYSMTVTTTAAPTPSGITGGGGSSGGKVCFIATAVYSSKGIGEGENRRGGDSHRFTVSPFPRFAASSDDPVTVLCRFRDEYLLTNAPGRAFVSCYERISPPIARYIEDKEALKAIIRFYLKPVVWIIREEIIKEEKGNEEFKKMGD